MEMQQTVSLGSRNTMASHGDAPDAPVSPTARDSTVPAVEEQRVHLNGLPTFSKLMHFSGILVQTVILFLLFKIQDSLFAICNKYNGTLTPRSLPQ